MCRRISGFGMLLVVLNSSALSSLCHCHCDAIAHRRRLGSCGMFWNVLKWRDGLRGSWTVQANAQESHHPSSQIHIEKRFNMAGGDENTTRGIAWYSEKIWNSGLILNSWLVAPEISANLPAPRVKALSEFCGNGYAKDLQWLTEADNWLKLRAWEMCLCETAMQDVPLLFIFDSTRHFVKWAYELSCFSNRICSKTAEMRCAMEFACGCVWLIVDRNYPFYPSSFPQWLPWIPMPQAQTNNNF